MWTASGRAQEWDDYTAHSAISFPPLPLPFSVCASPVRLSALLSTLCSFRFFLPLLVAVVALTHRGKLTGAWFCSIFELLVSFSFHSLAATFQTRIRVQSVITLYIDFHSLLTRSLVASWPLNCASVLCLILFSIDFSITPLWIFDRELMSDKILGTKLQSPPLGSNL